MAQHRTAGHQSKGFKHLPCTLPLPPRPKAQGKEVLPRDGTSSNGLQGVAQSPPQQRESPTYHQQQHPRTTGAPHTLSTPELPVGACWAHNKFPTSLEQFRRTLPPPLAFSIFPSTPCCTQCIPVISERGTSQKTTESAHLEIQARFAGHSHGTVSQTGQFTAALQSLMDIKLEATCGFTAV